MNPSLGHSVQSIATSTERPHASASDNIITVVLGLWLIAGIFIDGFAHAQLRSSIESFFTPWHAILYSGFTATALWTLWLGVQQARQGRRGLAAIPVGYELGFVGVVVFGLGGLGDMVWHTLLGIEIDIAALLSPPHLCLLLGGFLVVTSPLRSAWATLPKRPGFVAFLPALLSSIAGFSAVSFFHMHIWGLGFIPDNQDWMGWIASQSITAKNYALREVLAATLLTNVVVMSAILFLARRWHTPFGTFTFLLGINAALMGGLRGEFDTRIVAAALAGLVADALMHGLRPSGVRIYQWRAFAALVPLAIWGLHYAQVHFFAGGIGIEREFSSGLTVMSAFIGLALSVLIVPQEIGTGAENIAS